MLKIDHSRINAAIARAETTTTGEITCIIKAKSLPYGETPFAWGLGAALIAPLVLAFFGVSLEDVVARYLPPSVAGWQAAHASAAAYNHMEALGLYALIQLVMFLVVFFTVKIPAINRTLTPRKIRHLKAHQLAMEQFHARGLHLTSGHTGVMIFCALQDRYVTVIADEGIYTKAEPHFWDETVQALLKHIKSGDLTTGFEAAVTACGQALSAHYPPGADNPNELPDVLIEI